MSDNERMVLTPAEAGRILGLSRNSVYQGCLSGQIPCLRIGRRILIPKARLEELLNNSQLVMEK